MRAISTTITGNRRSKEHPRGRPGASGPADRTKEPSRTPSCPRRPRGARQVKASPADGRPRPALKVWIRVRPVCRGNSGFFYRSTGAIQDQPLTGKTSYPVMAKNYHR